MAKTYVTTQGDTWDLIAYKLFGAEDYMEQLIEANWPLADVLIFSAGTEIAVPEVLEDEIDEDGPFWRQDDDEEDEDEDEEDYSSTTDPEDEDEDEEDEDEWEDEDEDE